MKNLIDTFYKYKLKTATVIIFLAATFFVGDNTFLDGIRYRSKIKSLRQEVEYVKMENDKKVRQLKALQGDKYTLEKFAREQFLMTKAGEELFLIVDWNVG